MTTSAGRQGRLADYLTRLDFVVLDELGYLLRRERKSGSHLTRRGRKADSNRRSLPVNELVSQAGMRMQAGR
jgi:hypothetical protein